MSDYFCRAQPIDLPYGFRLEAEGARTEKPWEWSIHYRIRHSDGSLAEEWHEKCPDRSFRSTDSQIAAVARRLESLLSKHYPRLMKAPGNHFAKAALLTGWIPGDPEAEVLGPNWWHSKTTPDNLQLPNRCRQVLLSRLPLKTVMVRMGWWEPGWPDPLQIKRGQAPLARVTVLWGDEAPYKIYGRNWLEAAVCAERQMKQYCKSLGPKARDRSQLEIQW